MMSPTMVAQTGTARNLESAVRLGRRAWQDAERMLRSYDSRDFPADAVVAAKRGRRVSLCLPARNEESTVGGIVARVLAELVVAHRVVDELVVIDDGSTDRTAAVAAAAGARVVHAASVLPDHATGPGKGQALWKGVHVTSGDLVAFCDSDVSDFDPGFVLGLVGPLLADDDISFVKGFYERPVDGRPGEGGRVTELTARPLISMLFPHLASLVQPLAGECAARREVLEAVPFVGGYGVDLGLLIDVTGRFGAAGVVQCDLGVRVHRNRSLGELSAQAVAIVQVALERSGWREGDGLPWTTVLQRPGGQRVPVTMVEHPPLVEVTGRRKSA
jgi:glucosyl-3-phosphoglycerate synthase